MQRPNAGASRSCSCLLDLQVQQLVLDTNAAVLRPCPRSSARISFPVGLHGHPLLPAPPALHLAAGFFPAARALRRGGIATEAQAEAGVSADGTAALSCFC